MQEDNTYTLEQYLRGKFRERISDDSLMSIIKENGLEPNTDFSEIPIKNRELCLAGILVYLAGFPASTEKVSDSDANWSHSEGGAVYTAAQLNAFLRRANAIYKKYGLPTVGSNNWGMRGAGFHNIRNYGNR